MNYKKEADKYNEQYPLILDGVIFIGKDAEILKQKYSDFANHIIQTKVIGEIDKMIGEILKDKIIAPKRRLHKVASLTQLKQRLCQENG